MALGDKAGQYKALLAQMLQGAQSRPQAYPGHKVLAIGGGHPVLANMNVQNTQAGVDLGGILKLFGKHPDQKKAEREEMKNNASMAWMTYNLGFSQDDLNKMYSQPNFQEMLGKMQAVSPDRVWHNAANNRLEFVPMSAEMKNKLTGQKSGWEVEEIKSKINKNMSQSEQARAAAGLSGEKAKAVPFEIDLTKAKTSTEAASQALKQAEIGKVPSEIQKNVATAGQADATADFLKKDKGQGAVISQKQAEVKQKVVKGIMDRHQKDYQEATKTDIRMGTPEYNRLTTALNSTTIGTMEQLYSHGAVPELSGVLGSWLTWTNTNLNKTLSRPGGKLLPSDTEQLNQMYRTTEQIWNNYKDVIDAKPEQKKAIYQILQNTKPYSTTPSNKQSGTPGSPEDIINE